MFPLESKRSLTKEYNNQQNGQFLIRGWKKVLLHKKITVKINSRLLLTPCKIWAKFFLVIF